MIGDAVANTRSRLTTVIVLSGVAAACATGAFALGRSAGVPLTPVAHVRLPGNAHRFDYMSIDGHARRLYLAESDVSRVAVIELPGGRTTARIRVPGPRGVLVVPSVSRLFVSAAAAHQLWTVDIRSGRVVARAPA